MNEQSPNLFHLRRVTNPSKTGLNLETVNTVLSGTNRI